MCVSVCLCVRLVWLYETFRGCFCVAFVLDRICLSACLSVPQMDDDDACYSYLKTEVPTMCDPDTLLTVCTHRGSTLLHSLTHSLLRSLTHSLSLSLSLIHTLAANAACVHVERPDRVAADKAAHLSIPNTIPPRLPVIRCGVAARVWTWLCTQCVFVCLFARLFVCLFVCLFACLLVYLSLGCVDEARGRIRELIFAVFLINQLPEVVFCPCYCDWLGNTQRTRAISCCWNECSMSVYRLHSLKIHKSVAIHKHHTTFLLSPCILLTSLPPSLSLPPLPRCLPPFFLSLSLSLSLSLCLVNSLSRRRAHGLQNKE